MEMLGRGLSRRVPRAADLFAVTKDERNRNRNTTIIRYDIETGAIVPIFAAVSKWFNVNVTLLVVPGLKTGIQDLILAYTSVLFHLYPSYDGDTNIFHRFNRIDNYYKIAGEKKLRFLHYYLRGGDRNSLREAYFQSILSWEGIYSDFCTQKGT